jgi:hypothetical protein
VSETFAFVSSRCSPAASVSSVQSGRTCTTGTIQRFQNRLREAFLSGDRGTARVYLQNLIDHIVVGEESIVIEVRAGAALAMMAAARPASVESTGSEVLPDVVDWHARRDSNP